MKRLLIFLFLMSSSVLAATGPYESKIKLIQATEMGNPYNTVWLQLNVTDSPCPSTNQYDRFTIANDVQESVLLAALMGGKTVKIYGAGTCVGDVEQINHLQIFP
jgi:hypothetical protein